MRLRRDVSFRDLTSFRIGGAARYFCEASKVGDVEESLQLSEEKGAPFFVLGGGTNILADDQEFPGVVIQPSFRSLERDGTDIIAGAGVAMSELLHFAAEENLSGLEWAGGLPGTLGGAVRGNAGAFGGEIKDVVVEVASFNIKSRKVVSRDNAACTFGYRYSIFKVNGDEVIIEVRLRLNEGDRETVLQAIKEKIDYRALHHPLEYPNAGSIFRNVDVRLAPQRVVQAASTVVKIDPFPVIPAAYLVAGAGLGGVAVGGAMVSPKHTNFIVNTGGAASRDVRQLIERVKREVSLHFGVDLEEEIQTLSERPS
jgi:UDP-N-acetylmuramate dehydrogenase